MKANKKPLGLAARGAGQELDGCSQNTPTDPICQDYCQVANTFFKKGEVIEIRALGLTGKGPWQDWAKGTVSGYFDNPDKLAAAAKSLDDLKRATGIYFTMNPVNPALLARANNRLIAPQNTTADDQIVCHRWLLIDTDPFRPSGISATDAELKKAIICRNEIADFLSANGFPGPMKAYSGNGGHLLYRLPDLPNSLEITELKKQALRALNHRFGGGGVQVDGTVFNPARIVKLYGTMARKGDSTKDRPHRRSYLEAIPDPIVPVTLEQLQWLTRQVPEDKHPHAQGQASNGRKLDVEAYLSHYGIEISKIKSEDHRTIYGLRECIFNPEHTSNESAIVQSASGLLTYQCFHNTCLGRTWGEARERISGSDSLVQFIDGYVERPKAESILPGSPGQAEKQYLWEKPVLLDDFSLPEMEPVPGIIGEFSQAVSAATETPLELAMGMCLATVATACQRKFIVQVKGGYSEPLNIYVNAVLNSGERKTSVHTETTRPLTTWEAQQRFEMEPVVKEAEIQRRNQEARIKSLRARYGKAKRDALNEIEDDIRELESKLVEAPVMPKIWVQDITPEHLGTVMSHHNEKIAILSAEGGIFDIMAGRYSRGVPNFDLFLQGHSGDPVRVDRGSRDPIYLEHPALTMGLSTQPEVLRSIADAPGFRGRGLLARFLYLLPKSRLGHRTLETEPVPQHVKEKYESLIHALLNIEPATDEHGNNVPYILHLKCSAYEEWLEFSKVVEKELQEGGRFENVMDWAGKLPGAAARIAGLLHCVEHPQQPWSDQISLETMQQALGLGAIFSNHALKAFNLMGADKSLDGARKVWRWVERGRFKSFKKNDIYNALKGSFPRVADIEPCLDVLEERNYISFFKEKKVGRPSIMYAVNPNFYERWS